MTQILLDIDPDTGVVTGSVGGAVTVPEDTAHYVSPDGRTGATGTADDPWPIARLATVDAVEPGSVVLLLGGTYTGSFTVRIAGRSGAPITVMNAPGEDAVLDRALGSAPFTAPVPAGLMLEGSDVIVRENPAGGTLRLTNSASGRELDALHYRPECVRVVGARVKLINLRLDNGGGGVVSNLGADENEIYGCIITRSGWDSPVRGSGHGIYPQNAAGNGRKAIRHCVIANGYGHGVHLFGGSASKVADLDVEDCIVSFCCGASARERVSEGFLFDGDPTAASGDSGAVDGVAVRRSVCWQVYPYPEEGGVGQPSFRVGGSGHGEINGSVELTDSWMFGTVLLAEQVTALKLRGNILYTRPGTGRAGPVVESWRNLATQPEWVAADAALKAKYPANTYAVGVDAQDMPNAARVYPNAYERGRAHVAIVNGAGAAIVTVDLSGVCEPQRMYELVDVEAPEELYEPFTFTGAPIAFSMIRPEATAPVGGAIPAGRGTGVHFGVFLVRGTH